MTPEPLSLESCLLENNRSAVLKQPLILPVLYHKSATTCQIDSNKVSNSKLKHDLCNCAKTEITESMAPPHQLHKRGTTFLGHPVNSNIFVARVSYLERWGFYFETNNCIEFQLQENHGSESKVNFSSPYKSLTFIFLSYWSK